MTIPPNTNRKRFENGLQDLLEEEEIAGAEREEDEESLSEIMQLTQTMTLLT